MNIGFEAKRIFHNSSGLGNYGRNLLRALAQHFPQHQYQLFNPKKGVYTFGNEWSHVSEVLPPYTNALYAQWWRQNLVSQHAKKKQVNIFHGLSAELPKGLDKAGIPSVVTIHDLIFLRYPELYKNVDRKIYTKKAKWACKRADKIVAISQQTKSDLQQFLNIPEEKISVIYQGVNPVYWEDFNTETLTNTLAKYKLPTKFGLFVGTLETRKGVDKILEAIRISRVPMVFIGRKTAFWESQLKLSENQQIKNLIYNPTVKSNTELAHIYQLANFFLYPSIFEGFGIPVLEALTSKTPVITSNISSLPEVAGPSSILVNPKNADEIAAAQTQLWENPKLCKQIAEDGFTFAHNFNDPSIAWHWINLYQSLLKN